MAFCTPKELVAAGKKRGQSIMVGGRNELLDGIDEKRAEELLRLAFGDALIQKMPTKENRPWKLVKLTDKLDPNQAWLGFEFEMGLASETDYRRLVTYVWHEHNWVALDKEGAGSWSPEVTFPPEDASKFTDGTAGIMRLIKWMNEQGIKLIDFDSIPNGRGVPTPVGQHLNVSVPAMRSKKNAVACGILVAHTMWMMSEAKHKDLFGRVPYGLCRGRDEGAGAYCEFKLFKATDNMKTFKKYVIVSQRMADMMQVLCERNKFGDNTANDTPYIENFYEILSGTVSPQDVKIATASGRNAWGRISTGDPWRYHHGLCPNPVIQ